MISVFTPVHATSAPYLLEAYQSLCDQTVKDWEWVILENNGGKVPPEILEDVRTRLFRTEHLKGIGALKRFCCDAARGELLLELDADDVLAPTVVEECLKAFDDPSVMFAYSNTVEFEDDKGYWRPAQGYDSYYGWVYRDIDFRGFKLKEAVSWPATYQSLRRVLWSPNHLKAYRASAYKDVGGHDPKLALGDDQDLTCRFYVAYGQNGFCHIDKPLYFYRVHNKNTVKTENAPLQLVMHQLYLRYIGPMALRWAADERLACYDLGARLNRHPDKRFCSVDLLDADLNCDLEQTWPMPDSSVGYLRAYDLVEHISNQIRFYNEAYRVLAPGGLLQVEVPSVVGWDAKGNQIVGLGAFRDFSHKCYYSYQNFWYLTKQRYAQFLQPQLKARFQASRIETWMREENAPVVTAELICLKPGYEERHAGEIEI